MYGTERLKESISKISDSFTATEVIQSIVEDVRSFVGEAEQYDDMTIVVIKIPEWLSVIGYQFSVKEGVFAWVFPWFNVTLS